MKRSYYLVVDESGCETRKQQKIFQLIRKRAERYKGPVMVVQSRQTEQVVCQGGEKMPCV